MPGAEREPIDLPPFHRPACSSWTKRLITSSDHAAVQINVGIVDASGQYTGESKPYVLCGYIRSKGESDAALSALVAASK